MINLLNLGQKKSSTPSDWIHGAFYIINAASARIENPELDVIAGFIEKDIPIQVVLSKSDIATAEQKESLIKQLNLHFGHRVSISEVCSVQMRTRRGKKRKIRKRKKRLTLCWKVLIRNYASKLDVISLISTSIVLDI
ncbi:hypothetical protein HJ127_03150 [Vibrio parahaemolyticus]|nr:hypothetical protein [Vibrio parahaemolyticus]